MRCLSCLPFCTLFIFSCNFSFSSLCESQKRTCDVWPLRTTSGLHSCLSPRPNLNRHRQKPRPGTSLKSIFLQHSRVHPSRLLEDSKEVVMAAAILYEFCFGPCISNVGATCPGASKHVLRGVMPSSVLCLPGGPA